MASIRLGQERNNFRDKKIRCGVYGVMSLVWHHIHPGVREHLQ